MGVIFKLPSRTFHNLINSWILGFSGNDLHQYMDRAAKALRHKHRDVGHDTKALLMMLLNFNHKYDVNDIAKTWALHKVLDGTFSGFAKAVKERNQTYGKKNVDIMTVIQELKKEVLK